MRRWVLGLLLGIIVSSIAEGQDDARQEKLTDLPMETVGRSLFQVPASYGQLVNVVVSSDVHYLYFEDQDGTIRVVTVGLGSASSKARRPLQLLSPDVRLIKRGGEATSSLETAVPLPE